MPHRHVSQSIAVLLLLGMAGPVLAAPQLFRDDLGTVQIVARTVEELGEGYGRAAAVDGLCNSATIFAIRTGASAAHENYSTASVRRDLIHRAINPELMATVRGQGRASPSPDARRWIAGVVKGYNLAIDQQRGTAQQDPACAQTSLATLKISEADAWSVSHRAPSADFDVQAAMLGAAPPGEGKADIVVASHAPTNFRKPDPGGASIAIALGGEATVNGRGLLFAAPHSSSWDSRHFLRFTLAGEFDSFSSVSAYPDFILETFVHGNVAGGVTAHPGATYAVMELKLAADDPIVYVVDGVRHRMTRREVSVVSAANGARTAHVFYRSKHGFIIESELFPWTRDKAYAFVWTQTDAGATTVDNMLRLLRATSIADVVAAHHGTPSADKANYYVVDKDGNASSAPAGNVINLPDAQVARCVTSPLGRQLLAYNVAVLDGGRRDCDVATGTGSRMSSVAFADLPVTASRRAIIDANAAPWQWDPTSPRTGYSRFYDSPNYRRDDVPFSIYTNMRQSGAARLVADRLQGVDGEPGNRFDLATLSRRILNSDDYSAHLLKGDVLAFCATQTLIATGDGRFVSIAAACDVLRRWDNRSIPESRGAALWRIFFGLLQTDNYLGTRGLDFDTRDALSTPQRLRADRRHEVLRYLAQAVTRFEQQGVPLDIPLGESFRVMKGGESFATTGCSEAQGCLNTVSFNDEKWCELEVSCGRPIKNITTRWYGAMVTLFAGFDDSGRPIAAYATTASASQNSRSPYHTTAMRPWVERRTMPVDFRTNFSRPF